MFPKDNFQDERKTIKRKKRKRDRGEKEPTAVYKKVAFEPETTQHLSSPGFEVLDFADLGQTALTFALKVSATTRADTRT